MAASIDRLGAHCLAPTRGDHQTIRGIGTYLAIAFGLAWLPFAPAIVGKAPIAPLLMPFAPAIAAIVVRQWVTGEGFGDSGLRPNFRHWRLYLLAVAWPLATIPVSVVLAAGFRIAPAGFSVPWGMEAPRPLTLLAWIGGSVLLAPIIFGEELGWRGYLQTRLFPDQPIAAAIATGVIWGVWHYPMILVGDQNTASRALMLLLFPFVTTMLSVFLGQLRARTGEVWVGSVAHAANNVTEDSWHRLSFTGREDGIPSGAADVVVFIAEIVVLLGIVVRGRARR